MVVWFYCAVPMVVNAHSTSSKQPSSLPVKIDFVKLNVLVKWSSRRQTICFFRVVNIYIYYRVVKIYKMLNTLLALVT